MDKWLNNPNVVRVVALVLAVLLWALVQLDQRPPATSPNVSPPQTGQRTIQDIQVGVTGLDENMYSLISIHPTYVDIGLSGPADAINRFNPSDGQSRVMADLSGLGAGTHEGVTLRTSGFPAAFDVTIQPSHITVVIEEVQQKELPVEVDLEGQPAEGFRVGEPIVQPTRVYVSLPSSRMDEVAAVRAKADVTGASSTIVLERTLVAVNDAGEPVEGAVISPSVVRVEVPVTSPFKTVPLTTQLIGEPAEGFSVASIVQGTTEITLFASEDTLQQYDFYGNVEVDMTELTESRTFTLPIPLAEGIRRIHPQEVEVQVEIVPAETRTFEQIRLTLNGQNVDAETVFLAPESAHIDLLLEGAPNVLDDVQTEDIQAIVDVSNVPPGEYTLPVRLNLPAYVRYAGEEPLMARVAISEAETEATPDNETTAPADADEHFPVDQDLEEETEEDELPADDSNEDDTDADQDD